MLFSQLSRKFLIMRPLRADVVNICRRHWGAIKLCAVGQDIRGSRCFERSPVHRSTHVGWSKLKILRENARDVSATRLRIEMLFHRIYTYFKWLTISITVINFVWISFCAIKPVDYLKGWPRKCPRPLCPGLKLTRIIFNVTVEVRLKVRVRLYLDYC